MKENKMGKTPLKNFADAQKSVRLSNSGCDSSLTVLVCADKILVRFGQQLF